VNPANSEYTLINEHNSNNTKIGLYDKKRPEISCTPFIYYSFGQKLFDDKKSAFVAALIAPLKRVRRMVISVGFVKTVNAIL